MRRGYDAVNWAAIAQDDTLSSTGASTTAGDPLRANVHSIAAVFINPARGCLCIAVNDLNDSLFLCGPTHSLGMGGAA